VKERTWWEPISAKKKINSLHEEKDGSSGQSKKRLLIIGVGVDLRLNKGGGWRRKRTL